ncbi:lipopolysaccharide biosynthesis protein [Parasphingopyxis lamellibrachiae]|uniref:O-antigen/teichoic acid export membrane protein n=1 Tax=Parasphingopyxis lamellibrachiae TaxID=680125 RepID=A0A3D9FH16_9SPHN|nr:oligosaccharide flippase family protein [Parasphingopyxis lamellibrachiae]RED16381.1 O-antigen/teichoic acid export membrane protein [Parasphingopyxis lamellibrachiae]
MAAMARMGALIEVVAQPIYTWLFGIATYGLYIVFWSAVNMAEKVVDLSLTQALQRIVPVENEESAHGAVKFALLVTVIPALLIAALIAFFSPQIAGCISAAPEDAARLPQMIALFAWALPLWTFVEVATSAARARRAFGPEIRLRIFWEQCARLVFAIGFFFAGWTSIGLLLAHLLSLFLVAILSLRLLGRYYDLRLMMRVPVPAALRLHILLSGIALSPSAIARRILNDLPPIILNLILPGAQGATAAGLFGIARKVASVPLIVRQAFLYVLAPLSSAQAALDRAKIAPLYAFSSRLSVALVMPIGGLLILLGSDILSLFGPGAETAMVALVILTLGRMGEAVIGPATPIVEMTGHRLLPLINSMIGVCVWAVVSWMSVAEHGPEGMALAVSCGAVAIALAAVIELQLSDGLHPFDFAFLRGLVAGSVGVALLTLFGMVFEPLGAPVRAIALFVLIAPLCWVTLRLGLDQGDREALGAFARRTGLI